MPIIECTLIKGYDNESQKLLGDNKRVSAYHAAPKKSQLKGGIVLLQEIFGVNKYIREVCANYAEKGWEVIAPSLFDREGEKIELNYDAEGVKRGRALKEAVESFSEGDIAACCELFQPNLKLAVVGYCWGGSLAWRMACRHSFFDAAVCYYGGEIPSLSSESPRCAVQAHFGRNDKTIPMPDVEKFMSLRAEVETHVYDSGHGFSCHHRSQYHQSSAELASKRVDHFLNQHIENTN